jgi:MFS-type transporter involved in bile tolerance (Atg22 family)
LYIIYGIYYSTTEGIAKSLIVHLVPETHRGTAFGLFALPVSGIAGYLWDKFSPSTLFYFG